MWIGDDDVRVLMEDAAFVVENRAESHREDDCASPIRNDESAAEDFGVPHRSVQKVSEGNKIRFRKRDRVFGVFEDPVV